MSVDAPIRVLCVDDNAFVASAVEKHLERSGGIEWLGHLLTADGLAREIAGRKPTIVLLDLDMPGVDPLGIISEIGLDEAGCRVIVFSGHVRRDLVDRAIGAGAWGYISKNDGADALVDGIRGVADGEFALSPEVRQVCERG